MSQEKVMNRWLIVPAAIVVQMCLGVMYAWSVFTTTLTTAEYGYSKTETQTIFTTCVVVFAIVMIFAGRMLGKISPRVLCAAGGVLLGLGYIAASFVTGSFVGLLLTIGLISGAGIGLGYVVPISVGVKWFPDKKGMLTGLSVAGFGFGATFWQLAAGSYDHLIENLGVPQVFLIYGVLLTVFTVLGSLLMINPPEGYKPPGWSPPPSTSGLRSASGSSDLTAGEMLRTTQFYMLWIMFAVGSLAGLMVIGNIKLFAVDRLSGVDPSDEQLATAKAVGDVAMGIFFALANGMGRIGWGIMSDKLGRVASIAISFVVQGVVMLGLYAMGSQAALLYVAVTIIGFNYGGCFALFPAATADFFGNKNVGANYAWVFTSYGMGGIVGPILGGFFGDRVQESGNSQEWMTPFAMAGVACLVSAALTFLLRSKPAQVEAVANTTPQATETADVD